MVEKTEKFTEAEREAFSMLVSHGGSMLITHVPDKNEVDVVFKTVMPGMRVYEKLEKRGFLVITEEEPQEDLDGFCYTPSIELTDAGALIAKSLI